MASLNVAHELYAGLTRFSGTGVVPDLAQSWDVEQGGLVWTFHLRKNLRWSDDRRLTAGDFRRAWLRALAPSTEAPLAGPDLGIVRGARAYHATGKGSVGVQAVDDRTLRVTLQHPIPWLDQLVAHPIAAPWRPTPTAARSGSRRRRLVLERNFNYWNARSVKPSRLVLSTEDEGRRRNPPARPRPAGPALGPDFEAADRPRLARAADARGAAPLAVAEAVDDRPGDRSPTSWRCNAERARPAGDAWARRGGLERARHTRPPASAPLDAWLRPARRTAPPKAVGRIRAALARTSRFGQRSGSTQISSCRAGARRSSTSTTSSTCFRAGAPSTSRTGATRATTR